MSSSNPAGAAPNTVRFDDQITRYFFFATILWGVVGMLVGLIIATQLFWVQANIAPWFNFGRLRPLHTNAVIFAFTGNAIFAGVYFSAQRVMKTRMLADWLSWFHFWGWQLIIVAAAITLPLGITSSKEYAELEWPIDIAIAVVWVAFTVNLFGAVFKRREKHLYVAVWFYLATCITIAMLHIVNNLELPVSFTKSYPIYAGVQDALVQWWYGHNAVGFFLTTPLLGIMYYFVPKAAGRPVYSYRLSIIHFWGLIFIYIWAGPHHLHYTALPDWAQSMGMVFSLMLLAPSWGGMINGLLTLRGAWHKLRTDPVLKFLVSAVTFYGMSTFEGPLLSIKAVNMLSHYTDWTIGHVHSGALGWVGLLIFGMIYYLVPKLWKTELYSQSLANLHFWLAMIGIAFYVVSMWIAGVTQGLMWKEFNNEGVLAYPSFLETVTKLFPMYWMRLAGGLLYFAGLLLLVYNVLRSVAGKEAAHYQIEASPLIAEQTSAAEAAAKKHPYFWHNVLERKPVIFSALMLVAVAIGGIAEIIPTFLIESNVPTISAVKPYTPLELIGRDIYVREGCYNCHSQMIRPFRDEVARYGEYSKAGEFIYDHPFQFGSRRIGPDLHREGGLRGNDWHFRHLIDPQSLSPGSIMPSYEFMAKDHTEYTLISKKIRAMQKLGVPYSSDEAKNAETLARSQAAEVAAKYNTEKNDYTHKEITALIAYLQRLGTDIDWRGRGQQGKY